MANVSNHEEFAKALQGWARIVPPQLAIVVQKKVALEALTRIVNRTPVDTGRARGGWAITLTSPSQAKSRRADRDGGGTISQGAQRLEALKPYSVVWITNNVDYIRYLEQGTSKQAPNGMVAITLQELKTTLVEAS